jgi:hypothetical protein
MTETLTPGTTISSGLTCEQLVEDLRVLGIAPGKMLLVHASLRGSAWVDGGAPTVVAVVYEAEVDRAGPLEFSGNENSAYTMLDERNTAYLKEHGIQTAHP